MAQAKIADIEGKIRTLTAMRTALHRLTERCSGCGAASECPILESIDFRGGAAMTWRRAATVAPGIGVSLLPKLICPLCWPAYAGLLSALGLSFLINARNLVAITVLFLTVAVAALAFRARQRRGYGPALAGLTASSGILLGKFYLESPAMIYAALSILIAASIWNSWRVRRRRHAAVRCVGRHRKGEGL